MNRLLSILVTLFILFLVYLWINHLTGDTAVKKGPDTKALSQPEEDEFTDDTYRVPDNDTVTSPPIKTDDADEPSAEKDDPPAAPVKTPVKTPEKPKPAESRPKSTPKPPPTETVKTVTKSVEPASGLHLIIAGNFLEKANAEERVRQLQKLGYPLAEVVNFELSEYHTACAGRYSDLNEARRISKKIKEMHGIDTYVRLGN